MVIFVDNIASFDTMKRIVYCVKLSFIIILVSRARGGLHPSLSADILILSSPSGLLTGKIY